MTRVCLGSVTVQVKRVSGKASYVFHSSREKAVKHDEATTAGHYWREYGHKWRFSYRVNVYLKETSNDDSI